jgi:hypothetical protein
MCFPSSELNAVPKEDLIVFSATLLEIGTRLSLKLKVINVITNERKNAGMMILILLNPKLFNAVNSELEDSFPYASNVAKSIDIGKDKTRKPGSFKISIFNAI